MGLFTIKTDAASIQETAGASYISKSGIYDVTINFASVATSKNGAHSVNFNIDWNGNSQAIYGPYVTDKEGNPLKIGLALINKLGIIAGLGEGDEPTTETETHKVGKDNREEEFEVITDFSDLDVKIRLQEEYSINPNTNEIRKSMVPRAFYRADGASAEEIVDGTEIGVQLKKDEAYASNVTYRDDLTAEDVEAWKQSKKDGEGASAPKPKTTPKAQPKLFGKK